MKSLTQKMAGSLLLTATFFSPLVFANDVNLGAHTIPASACQPTSSVEDNKLKLANGAYVFRANVTGTATLICPLSLNGWKAGMELFNQNWSNPSMKMTTYQVYYRDPNTCSSSVGVETTLRYRNATGIKLGSDQWTSSSTGGGFCFPGISTNTTKVVASPHSLKKDRLYHFLIKMKRTSINQQTVFTGIDFPIDINIPQ